MIAHLKGVVAAVEGKSLIIDVGGVGYRVAVGGALLATIVVGQDLTVFTYHHITDSDQALFGFATAQDLDYFKLLLTVPSVGPKTAMGILDSAPPSVLEQAVHTKDMMLLTKISGVGKRTAERILVELSGKMTGAASQKLGGLATTLQRDAVEALISIGFKPKEARDKVLDLPADIATVEDAVKAALKTHS